MPKACVVPHCKSGCRHQGIKRSVFKVPSDETRRKQWVDLIPGIINLKATQYICERHFRPEYITKKYAGYDKDGKLISEANFRRPYLTADAVPTIFMEEDDESRWVITKEATAVEQNELGGENQSQSIQVESDGIAEDTAVNRAPGIDTDPLDTRANEIGAQSETTFERCLLTDPPIKKLQVLSSGSVTDGKNVITLPLTWSVTHSRAQIGTEITFCHITTLTQNDIRSLIVTKYFVIENWTGRIQFYVHGRKCCTDNTPLPNTLQNASLLRETLATFHRMHICRGLGSLDPTLIENDAFQDQSNSWHSYGCTLLTDKPRICGVCKTLGTYSRRIERRTDRRIERLTVNLQKTKKVARITNSQDQIESKQDD